MNEETDIIKEVFKIPTEYTKSVIQGFHNSFILLGGQGQGKTTAVINTLMQEKADFVYHSGISTPKALFEFLYDNREGKVVVFDDCAGLINNLYALSIMLSAMWSFSDKRIISWNTTNKSAKVPCQTKYIFNSKIIIIANKMPNSAYSKVVLSRCLNYEMNLTYKQILQLMYAIGDKEVVDYLRENSSEATRNFDLRLLRKAESFKKYDAEHWKELIKPMLDDKDHELQLIIMGVSENKWCIETGKSRRTYYRRKHELVPKCHEIPNYNQMSAKVP